MSKNKHNVSSSHDTRPTIAYLPKPVDVDRLFSMLRVWLYQ